ncbi:MAG TPA: Lrp/AsnC family transcriptional regulator [Thermoplasmata archaeon]|nr:Lrp/AsnC family transcriptional regulator [Thermoplasmata archaeon]
MDDLDRQILEGLREDARITNASLGERVGLTEAAVRRRIRRLTSDGTIRRFTIVTVPLGPEGLVLIRCRPGRTSEILRYVRERAAEVFETSGEYDVGALLERSSMEELNQELDRIRGVDGVVATLTLIRLAREFRGSGPPRPSGTASHARGARTLPIPIAPRRRGPIDRSGPIARRGAPGRRRSGDRTGRAG